MASKQVGTAGNANWSLPQLLAGLSLCFGLSLVTAVPTSAQNFDPSQSQYQNQNLQGNGQWYQGQPPYPNSGYQQANQNWNSGWGSGQGGYRHHPGFHHEGNPGWNGNQFNASGSVSGSSSGSAINANMNNAYGNVPFSYNPNQNQGQNPGRNWGRANWAQNWNQNGNGNFGRHHHDHDHDHDHDRNYGPNTGMFGGTGSLINNSVSGTVLPANNGNYQNH